MRKFYNKLTSSVGQLISSESSRALASPDNEDWYRLTLLSTRAKLMSALSRMLSPEESEEVIQEVYLKLFLISKTDKPENPTAYVYRLSRNLAISRLRNQTVANRFVHDVSHQIDVLPHNDPQTSCTAEENKHLLLGAINSLPPICRQVFVLRKLHGKSHKEIAEDLGISIKTVENHIYRGMQHCHHNLTRSHYSHNIKPAKKLA